MAPRLKKSEAAKLQIYADAEHIDDFTSFFKQLGMSQREAGSRLFAWFNRQSPAVRQLILQPMPPDIGPDVARIILERMAAQDGPGQPQMPPNNSSNDVKPMPLPDCDSQRMPVSEPD